MKGDSLQSSGTWVAVSEADRLRLKAAQIRQLYAQAPSGVYGAALTVVVLTAALWNLTPRWLLMTWCLTSLVVYTARQRLVSAFGAAAPDDEATIRWGWWYAAGCWTAAILWSVAAFFLFPHQSVLHQALLSLLVGGICAGTIAAYCPRKESYLPFVVLVMLSLAGRYFYEGDSDHITMGAMAVVLLVCFVFIGNRMHATNTASLKLGFRNEDLVKELTEKEAGTQALNEDLKSEIAERLQAEEALRQSEERYRLLVDNANDLIYTTDLQGHFTFANPVALRITGYSEEEVLGKTYRNLVPEAYWNQLDQFYRSQFGERKSETYLELPVITKKGELIWTGQNVQLIMEGDRVIGFQGISRDITERKRAEEALRAAHDMLEIRVEERTAELSEANVQLTQEIAERKRAERLLEEAHFQLEEQVRECFVSEERFRTVFEAAEDCMFIKDRDLLYTHVNPAMLQLLEMDQSEIVGKSDADLFGPGYSGQTEYQERRVLEGQTVESQQTMVWKDWPTTWSFVRFPMRDRKESIIGVCGIARDVTERSRQERDSARGGPDYLSPLFLNTLRQVEMAAQSDSVVLFLGESGSGKDWLARYLHDHSKRSQGPFFAINCAALHPELIESELFGHEAGAFTGARGRKRGLIELAEGGTLLLNEVGEIPPELQAKLLAFLDTRSFTRVGGERSVSPNARVVAATNRDVQREVEQGRFRSDLYYRLNVFAVEVPPLRDRTEDIPILAQTLLESLAEKMGITELPALDPEAIQAITDCRWPGNVRELGNLLERALIRCRGKKITVANLSLEKEKDSLATDRPALPVIAAPGHGQSLPDALEMTKRTLIANALAESGGSIKEAAARLGISRESLKHHMRRLDIQR